MARRRATKKYESIFDFVTDYTTSLSNATINLLPGSYRGELANEIKLDLSIPEFGRIGPIVAQVIFRDPSGLVALRLPQVPPEVLETYQKAKQHCNDLVQPYVEAGLVVHKEEHDATLASMQKQLEDQKKEFEQKLADAIAQLKAESEAKLEELREELEAQRAAIPEKTTERGIPIVDFSQLAPLANGAMHQFDTFLIEAAKQQWTGLLYIDQGSQRRFAYLDQGAIVAWRSDPLIEKEVLGILLYSFKQITEEQLKQSLQLMEEKNIRQGEALVELGVMGFPQMVVVLSKQVEYIFQQVRKQKKGTYSFYETALPERFLSNKLFFINIRIRELRKKAKSLSANMLFRNLSGSLGKKVYLEKILLKFING